jgi:hypothetical protein
MSVYVLMRRLDGVGSLDFKNLRTNDIAELYWSLCCSNLCIVVVPDHNGGRPMEVNACILITHRVYL